MLEICADIGLNDNHNLMGEHKKFLWLCGWLSYQKVMYLFNISKRDVIQHIS